MNLGDEHNILKATDKINALKIMPMEDSIPLLRKNPFIVSTITKKNNGFTSNLLSHFILIIRSIHFIFSRKDNIFFQQYYTPNQSSYQKQHPTSISLLIQYKSD